MPIMYNYGENAGGILPINWIITIVVVFGLIVAGICIFSAPPHHGESDEEWCKGYGDQPISDLPVKCFQYFSNIPSTTK